MAMMLGVCSNRVLAFFSACPGDCARRAHRVPTLSAVPLKRSPHAALEEKGLLVERLLEAKVSPAGNSRRFYVFCNFAGNETLPKHVLCARGSPVLHARRRRYRLELRAISPLFLKSFV